MPLLSNIATRRKIDYFIRGIPINHRILEIGSGSGELGRFMKNEGWSGYVGVDQTPPADIVGSIKDWDNLGIEPESFDHVIAFGLIEHVDCFREIYEILKPGGIAHLTSPVPRLDIVCKVLEWLGRNQKRTSDHTNLIYFEDIPHSSR